MQIKITAVVDDVVYMLLSRVVNFWTKWGNLDKYNNIEPTSGANWDEGREYNAS